MDTREKIDTQKFYTRENTHARKNEHAKKMTRTKNRHTRKIRHTKIIPARKITHAKIIHLNKNLFQFCRNRIKNFTFVFEFFTWYQVTFCAFMYDLFMFIEYISINLNTRHPSFICSVNKYIRV